MASEQINLNDLKSNTNYWFWLAQVSENGKPALSFYNVSKDDNGQQFNRTITQKRWAAPDIGYEMRGIARKTSLGKLVLTSQDRIDYATEVLNEVSEQNPEDATALNNVVLVRTENGKFVSVALSGTPSGWKSPALDALQNTGDSAFFIYGTSKKGPQLFVQEDRDTLKKTILSVDGFQMISRGQLAIDSKGRLAFRVKSGTESLATEISDFGKHHKIDRFKRAYVHIKNKNTGEESRHKLSSDW
ncbi:MAG: hypothetical protein ACON4U_02890 [Myxococcota bacterium]